MSGLEEAISQRRSTRMFLPDNFPDTLHAQLEIPVDLTVLCGLAIGYPDPGFPANHLDTPRNAVGDNVIFRE
ncbi:hypothetical protein H7I53_15820 [Mycolicibacterium pulveris]|uniref:hypothetical protein n=1 Tax=Mycolicibacterium pulveris TaxID=36813 RepID=UPI0013D4C757|nr:hypothetical protein [Mycolicibacterium pulveris]MCV6981682.1 hypothetical protein [Mycolicibacterium pulveris]